MADFNAVLTVGDYQNGIVNTVVEIPQGSFLKVEWHRDTATFMIDRVEPSIYAKPVNYGFIPQTLDEDGDRWKQKIAEHFSHYKDLKKPGTTMVNGWGDVEAAKAIIAESIERWNARQK
jgi:inorganic pyrophosphatase